MFCLVSVDRTDGSMTANLMAPLVVNVTAHTARQVVLDADLPVRAALPMPGPGSDMLEAPR